MGLTAAGLEAIVDLRGKDDLFGNVLRVASQAIADDLGSSAQLLMGEADEAILVVLARGLNRSLLRDAVYPPLKFSIPIDEDVYLRSLGYVRLTSEHIHF